MPVERNFLLGKGEKLARRADVALSFGPTKHPYSLPERKSTLIPEAKAVSRQLLALPDTACPDDEAVAVLTLHPAYISKSSFPSGLLNAAGLRSVGSRQVTIAPKKWTRQGKPKPVPTTELFVAGPRSRFQHLPEFVQNATDDAASGTDLIKIENLHAIPPTDRIKPLISDARNPLLEVVLYAGEDQGARRILDAFRRYLHSLDIDVDLRKRIDTGELSFVPVRAPRDQLADIAKFSFLRMAREMPRLRQFNPSAQPATSPTIRARLPEGREVVDPTIKVAIFDGGLPDLPSLRPWVRRLKGDGVIGSVEKFKEHGLQVTSALLFGPLQDGIVASVPYAKVDHYRVLDEDSGTDPQGELYPVLMRISKVLRERDHDFAVLSVGPDLPVDDDDINAWTATLDQLTSSGKPLVAVAVGNSGELNAKERLNRIQPPSDGVNLLAIGACNSQTASWARAAYSAVGPGRSPGIVKPDCVAFGGVENSPFYVIDPLQPTLAKARMGTSFAAPFGIRTAIGIRAHLGPALGPLALKALLIHSCEEHQASFSEVGYGRICDDIEEIITCPPGIARVVYQGYLEPKRFLRAVIPVPAVPMPGNVTVAVTVCIATEVDSEHPMHYTRSGLEIFLRRDLANRPPGKINPKPSTFFSSLRVDGLSLRPDAHEWETIRHANRTMRGASLRAPALDIHYNPRVAGHDAPIATTIPYAMVITLSAPRMPNLYDRIWQRYRFQLEQMRPQVSLPIRVQRR